MVDYIKAKKYFGQNFLTDRSFIDKIIQSMPDIKGVNLVEIGPGLGDLTKALLERYTALRAYEVDEELYEHLKDAFKEEIKAGRLELCLGDVLEYWKEDVLCTEPYFICANIPYYITTPIIYGILEDKNCVGAVLMVQKEVALKLAASCGCSDYSSLSVLVQILSDASILFEVPKSAFSPQPKIDSAVICMRKKMNLGLEFCDIKKYILTAFKARGKTLRKNLLSCYEQAKEQFFELDIKPNLRPHELAPDMHFRLFKNLNK
ncbi:MAG: 16S rRNA (adenine(1518)-N(6)/adenine(1519)-N(6))-dimethyltransferase RsmA [Campylobacteraceae bacterium]|jgi:16S rRNA (adenine1518-N6/adenine1519-N6)-dimethyltransferase|nr:16S rRNA (adenine(1518)-N(6)/adenine(1519)-N(6))-dimethyltransferase RsmA [Campylobacteraceae bacterium]